MSNPAVKLCQGKHIAIGLMFTTKYSCCYNSLKLFCLHTCNNYQSVQITFHLHGPFGNRIESLRVFGFKGFDAFPQRDWIHKHIIFRLNFGY